MNFLKSEKKLIGIILFIITIIVITFFDKTLAIGLIFISFLCAVTFLVINKNKEQTKILGKLFLIAFLIHFAAVLFIYYAHFQPFSGGGGDYNFYQQQAQEIAGRIQQGNFFLQGIGVGHYYPVIVGYIYAFTLPEMLIGQLFNAWLAALCVIFVYLIVQEIGGSKKQGIVAGLVVSVYPSLLFFGSLLLKDALVVLLCLIGLLLILKLIKRFSWPRFLLFYIVLIGVTQFRFYIGYALILCFIISWIFFSNLKIKKRLAFAVIIIFLLGFVPEISVDYGYFGMKTSKRYLNVETVTYYREVVYAPSPPEPSAAGSGSSVVVETGFGNPFVFLKNSLISFSYSLFGPFPWQMKQLRHFLALPEVIAWYFLFFFIIKGIVKNIGKQYRVILPLVIFSCFVLGTLALFITNFGIITRIRMPAFISLLCLVPFGFERLKYIKIPFLNI